LRSTALRGSVTARKRQHRWRGGGVSRNRSAARSDQLALSRRRRLRICAAYHPRTLAAITAAACSRRQHGARWRLTEHGAYSNMAAYQRKKSWGEEAAEKKEEASESVAYKAAR